MAFQALSRLYSSLTGFSNRARVLTLILIVPAFASAETKPLNKASVSDKDIFRNVQPYFERNDGQFDPQILFFTRGNGYSVLLERDGVVILANTRSRAGGKRNPTHAKARFHFIASAETVRVKGKDDLPGTSNYFSGSDPSKWITHVPHFAAVTYQQIYPGIDLVFYFKEGHLEYDFSISSGADPGAIRIGVQGAKPLLTASGEIALTFGGREVARSKKPEAYLRNGGDTSVPVRYVLDEKQIRFKVGSYDRHESLTIDPALSFATFVMADCLPDNFPNCIHDSLVEMAADKTGVYLTGSTFASTFPSVAGQPPATQGASRGYVVKLDSAGSQVLYATFISSFGPGSLAIDSNGEAFVSGGASPGFPTTAGAFNSTVPTCNVCGFPAALKLSSDGSTLLYSTLLMVSDANRTLEEPDPLAMAVDANGNVYIMGNIGQRTMSDAVPLRFPTTVGSFQTTPGDDFLMKLNSTGSALVYSTYVHPNAPEGYAINDLAVDASGAAYLTGIAGPSWPTTAGSYQATATSATAFLSKLSADGSSLVYSTFFGATVAYGVAVDSSGEAVIVGAARGDLPTVAPLCPNDPQVILQGFITKFNAAGSALVYSTGLCNSNPAFTAEGSVAVDSSGAAYVLGELNLFNSSLTFPLLHPIQGYTFHGINALTIIKLDSAGAEQWGSLLGSSSGPVASNGNKLFGSNRIRLDGAGAVYVLSSDPEFPTTPKSLQPVNVDFLSEQFPFVAKIVPSIGAAVPVVSPAAVSFPNPQVTGTSSSAFDVIVGNFGDADMSSSPTISITGDFSQINTCSSAVLAAQKCDINVVFTPTAAGTRAGILTVKFSGFPDQTVPLSGSGTAPVVVLSSTSLTFPPEPVGTTSPAQQVTVSNTGNGPLNISLIQISGDFAQTNTCGSPVAPGSNCSVMVTSTPTVQGKRTGTITLNDNATNTSQQIALSGFGGQSAAVLLSPQSANFPGQIVATSSSATTVTISNVGNLPLSVSSIGVNGDYSQTNNCTSPVAPGGNCTAQVSFSPTATGQRNGMLTITDNSFTTPETVPLSGVGADFSFGIAPSSSATATITAGQTANYTLTAAPMTNAGGTLNFSCQGVPAKSSCTVSPSSVTLNNAAQNVTVMISTAAGSFTGMGMLDPNRRIGPPQIVLPVLLSILLAMIALRQKRLRWSLVSLAVFLFCAGCGGGGGAGGGGGGTTGTPRGTYTIVVTAAPGGNGAASHTTNLTLNVQ